MSHDTTPPFSSSPHRVICDGGVPTKDTTNYVSQKWVQENALEDREYQRYLARAAEQESTLIALPTGTGKTAVAARIIARRLDTHSGKVLMIAPTQPLVRQHADFFTDVLSIPDHEIQIFTGDIRPDKREEKWDDGVSIVLATPQVIENDLIGNRYTLEDVSHIVFDECHRATGDYAYTYIAERYHGNATNPLATGLSASPGSSKEDILTVCENIGVTNVEVFTETDDILREYLHDTDITHKWLELPDELLEARDLVQKVYKEKLVELKEMGVLRSASKDLSFHELNKSKKKIQRLIDNGDSKGYKAISIHSEAMKLNHGWQTIETQSPSAAIKYFERIFTESDSSDGSKAAQRIADDSRIKRAVSKLKEYDEVHPKYKEMRMQVAQTLADDGQVLIFTDSRDTASDIVEFLESDKINPVRFVGQRNKDDDPGLSQTEQQEVLDQFRSGEKNVLVSTSVAEEGIDIPAVDLVLFFEPVPDAVRTVQRRGRTGRETDGNVVILIAKDTGDVGAYYAAQSREEDMKKQLEDLKEMEAEVEDELREEQQSLADFGKRDTDADAPVIYVDTREKKSKIVQTLDRTNGILVKLDTLDTADYVVSERVGIERKTLDDFVNSITESERDILTQIKELSNAYSRPVLLVEGGTGVEDLYGRAQVSEEAIRSMLQTIAIDFNVKLLFTHSVTETVAQLQTLARREQEENNKKVNPHGVKDTESLPSKQEYVISSIPDIGPVTAQKLLTEFESPLEVVTASVSELESIDGIGPSKAETIHTVMTSEYKSESSESTSSADSEKTESEPSSDPQSSDDTSGSTSDNTVTGEDTDTQHRTTAFSDYSTES